MQPRLDSPCLAARGMRLPAVRLLAGLATCLAAGLPAVAHPEIQLQIDKVTRQIAADPSNAALYLQRGDLHRIHENWSTATADFDRARVLDPDLHLVDFCMGKMSLEAGQPKEALAPLNRFLAKERDDAEGLTLQLQALDVEIAMKRFDEALSRLDRLASASARPEPWLVRRGEILEHAGRLPQARHAYFAAVEAITAQPPSRRNVGTLGKLEQEARAALQRIPEDLTERTRDQE